ncbi:MAG: phosphoribosylformylglycinamidine synthase subunit PurS [bacterium]
MRVKKTAIWISLVMKKYIVEILQKKILPDPIGKAVVKDAHDAGIEGLGAVRVGRLYRIEGRVSNDNIVAIASKLLADPITEDFKIQEVDSPFKKSEHVRRIEVWFHASVTDTVGETVKIGISDLGIQDVSRVATGKSYIFAAKITDEQLKNLAHNVLANTMINKCVFY